MGGCGEGHARCCCHATHLWCMWDMTVHRCANCACSTRLRTATDGLGRSNRCVAVFTPPDKGARRRPVVLTGLVRTGLPADSYASSKLAGISTLANPTGCFAAAFEAASPLSELLLLLPPLLLLLLLLLPLLLTPLPDSHCTRRVTRAGRCSRTEGHGEPATRPSGWCLRHVPANAMTT